MRSARDVATNREQEFRIATRQRPGAQEEKMQLILIILLVLLLIGSFPAWPYSAGWGYYPFGGLGLILLIVLIVMLV